MGRNYGENPLQIRAPGPQAGMSRMELGPAEKRSEGSGSVWDCSSAQNAPHSRPRSAATLITASRGHQASGFLLLWSLEGTPPLRPPSKPGRWADGGGGGRGGAASGEERRAGRPRPARREPEAI